MRTPSARRTLSRRAWGADAADPLSDEQRRMLARVQRGELTQSELIAYFGPTYLRVGSGVVLATKFGPNPLKMFLPDERDDLAGGVVGLPTPYDPQSDRAAPQPPVRVWAAGVTLTPEPYERDADEVLARLRSNTEANAREAVLDSEAVDFATGLAGELVPLLRQYVERHRRASDRESMIATAAAIRGYIAHMPAEELEAVAELLARNDMPSALENETVKMVVQKLTAVPPSRDEQFPNLADQVAGLATSYTVPRLINREHYGATALNAVVATAMLRTSRWGATFSQVAALPDRGFRRQVGKWASGVLTAPRTVPLPTEVAVALESLTKLVD